MGTFTIPPDDTPATFPQGHKHWFFRCFNWLCGKDIKLDTVEQVYHRVICNCAVYTTDGRFFYGYYTPHAAEDLDPFSMMPPDFIFCCHCCCYTCCRCFRERFDTKWKQEADLFFKRHEEKGAQKESIPESQMRIEWISQEAIPLESKWSTKIETA